MPLTGAMFVIGYWRFGPRHLEYGVPKALAMWFFLSICATLVWVWVKLAEAADRGLRSREWRIALKGVCVRCGYDLRASPDRCPECGERVIPPSRAGEELDAIHRK